jgi:hypothetical protein
MHPADDDPMLPSLFASGENARPWSVPRAALCGAGLGLLAALIKLFDPFHAAERTLPFALEIGLAVLAEQSFAPVPLCCVTCWPDGSTTRPAESAITDETARCRSPVARAG